MGNTILRRRYPIGYRLTKRMFLIALTAMLTLLTSLGPSGPAALSPENMLKGFMTLITSFHRKGSGPISSGFLV